MRIKTGMDTGASTYLISYSRMLTMILTRSSNYPVNEPQFPTPSYQGNGAYAPVSELKTINYYRVY
jgi:hypothetical protein